MDEFQRDLVTFWLPCFLPFATLLSLGVRFDGRHQEDRARLCVTLAVMLPNIWGFVFVIAPWLASGPLF